MNPEEKQLLQKTHNLVEENNKILRHIRKSNRLSVAFRIFYWLIIISVSIGAFYYIEPYIKIFKNVYGTIQTDLDSIKNSANKIQGLIK